MTVDIESVSPVGLGCYRMRRDRPEHREAFGLAARRGVNLVDTASNYGDGESELFVGELLRQQRAPLFVVTKLGYITPASAAYLAQRGVDPPGGGAPGDGRDHTLDVDVLGALLDLSQHRLGLATLDAVLVHNPEKAGSLTPGGEALAQVADALALLERERCRGRIRFYGISSNRLAGEDGRDALAAILDAVPPSTVGDGFRFLQLPYNLIETGAGRPVAGGSVVSHARERGLRLMANRPLNAISAGRPVRLAHPVVRRVDAEDAFRRCVAHVRAQLDQVGAPQPWSAFGPMQFIRDTRNLVIDLDLVEAAWASQVGPFLEALYGPAVPPAVAAAFEDLHEAYRHRYLTSLDPPAPPEPAASAASDRPGPDGAGSSAGRRAVRFCLDSGFDHVLAGMRRPQYVDDIVGPERPG